MSDSELQPLLLSLADCCGAFALFPRFPLITADHVTMMATTTVPNVAVAMEKQQQAMLAAAAAATDPNVAVTIRLIMQGKVRRL